MILNDVVTDVKCKICGSNTTAWAVLDFNKSCEHKTPNYERSGIGIHYVKCETCGYLFTPSFDNWTKADFLKYIYNEEYIKADPEYNGVRSIRDSQWFIQNVPNKSLQILDYGAGPAVLGRELKNKGYDIESWDPMWGIDPTWPVEKKFDLITSFEVFEHTPTPLATLLEAHKWLKPGGQIFITTLINELVENDANYWYVSPCNGHIGIHSINSLDRLFANVGMKVQHHGHSFHLAHY
jgi:SAM-dependent methyltransferase